MIDARKRAVVPMFNNRTQKHEFDIIVYGRSAAELMVVPNEVIWNIAEKYPGYSSSPFLVEDM